LSINRSLPRPARVSQRLVNAYCSSVEAAPSVSQRNRDCLDPRPVITLGASVSGLEFATIARDDWTALVTEPAAEYLARTELERFDLRP
jgi:hypothetical protein